MRRGQSGLSALVAVDKPEGITSHDVVGRLRHALSERRIGHCGTLDPFASGLLICGVGPATRLLPYITGHDKSYIARIEFGTATDTCDPDGQVSARMPVPESLSRQDFAEEVLSGMQGPCMQVPPAYSAKRVDGRHSYERARSGQEVQLDAVPVEVKSAQLICVSGQEGAISWDVRFDVSAGTYIRALARDIGSSCGTCAHLSKLRRISVGGISVCKASDLDEVSVQALCTIALDPVSCLSLQAVELEEGELRGCMDGKRIAREGLAPGQLYALVSSDRLYGVHEAAGGVLVPRTVIPGGVGGVRG